MVGTCEYFNHEGYQEHNDKEKLEQYGPTTL